MDDYLQKCGITVSEMRMKLQFRMTQDEKYEKLKEVLNGGQYDYYKRLINHLEWAREESDRIFDKGLEEMFEGRLLELDLFIDECEKEAFKWERRIFEGGFKEKEPVSVDESTFREDEQFKYSLPSDGIGGLENELIEKQKSTLRDLDEDDIDSANYWFNNGGKINHEIYKSHDWNKIVWEDEEYDTDLSKVISNNNTKAKVKLDKLFDGLEPLGVDVVCYRGGSFDLTKMVGNKVKFKGYTSVSFQEGSAKTYMNTKNQSSGEFHIWNMWEYKFLIRGENKGLIGNDDRFVNGIDEHEMVLPRNTEADILDIDYDKRVVTVLV